MTRIIGIAVAGVLVAFGAYVVVVWTLLTMAGMQ